MKRKARLLVVDDEAGVLSTLERLLERDYELATAATQEQARELMAAQPFDLAIVDLVLPDGDGFTLLKELRSRPERPEVIVITGDTYDADEKLARALRGQAFYFLTKPFDAVALDALVKRCLEVRALQRALLDRSRELERDLDLARDFQRGLMPRTSLQHGKLHLEAFFQPCDALAGDFFDYRRRGGHMLLLVADVVGHGVSAAMLSGMLASAWSRAARDNLPLREIHRRLQDLVHDWDDSQFFSAFLAVIDSRSGRLEYINSGHPPPLLWQEERLGELAATGPVISPALGDIEPEAEKVKLLPGARLCLYTDGIPEARSPDGRELGDGVVRAAARSQLPLDETLGELERRLREHCAGRPQEDDWTALLLTRTE